MAGLDLHHFAAVVGHEAAEQLWVPGASVDIPLYPQAAAGAPAQAVYASYDEHKARTPPPDLPSLLLDSRITFLGMPVWPLLRSLQFLLSSMEPGIFKAASLQPATEE